MTRTLPLLALLLSPAATAAVQDIDTPWYPAQADSCRRDADGIRESNAGLDTILRELGGTQAKGDSSADTPSPGETEGDSIATCDNGLFFDASRPHLIRLIYLDNVRLDDKRLKLHAAHRLYLQIRRHHAEEEAKATAKDEGLQPRAAQKAENPAPADPDMEDELSLNPTGQPLVINAYDAMVDTAGNNLLFTAGPGAELLRFELGDNSLHLRADEGKPARLLADAAGNLLMEGSHISIRWKNAEGQSGSLESDGGCAFYHSSSDTLVLEGPVVAEQSTGERIETEGRLCVRFRVARKGTDSKHFMGQFTSLQFEGIAALATEQGRRVALSDRARGISAAGNCLRYNGLTGEVELQGEPCMLHYGRNYIAAKGRLMLEEDGSIALSGSDIHGAYERPSRAEEGITLHGSLRVEEELRFHAASGTITTRGLSARDAEADFSCTGPVEITLTPLPDDKLRQLPARENIGMLNLAIARYGDIASLRATGQVRAHGYAPGTQDTPESSLAGSSLEADLLKGTILLRGQGEAATLNYNGYTLAGSAAEGEEARVQLLPNGDIEVKGAWVDAALPGRKGLTTLRCTESATLQRESRRLTLGPGAELRAPEGILTANGPLVAVLAASNKPARAASPRYPQLSYNFSGLESAETQQGATVRSEQGSLQCTQQLSVTMEPSGSNAKKSLGGIRSALARGEVAIAARDSQGRIMRATGDMLTIDGETGEKLLTGSRVVLEDENNRHTASGGNASVRIDARNNARISGARHETTASGIRRQVDKQKNQQRKKR